MAGSSINIAMDVSGNCNLRCKMCYFSLPEHRSNEHMPLDVFERLCADWSDDALSLSLSMGAEPLIVKEFPRYLEIAKEHGVKNVSFVSNATLLTPELAKAVIDNGVQYVAFSVDGATKGTYEAIRIGAKWERVVSNIETLARMKRERGSKTPYITFHYLLFKSNYEELVDFIELASTWGASEVNVGFAVEHEGIDLAEEAVGLEDVAEILEEAAARARQRGILLTGASAALVPGAKKLGYYAGVVSRRIAMRGLSQTIAEIDTRLRLRTTKCPYLNRSVFVDAMGDVRPCCLWFHDPPMGNIRDDSLRTVWNSQSFMRLRTLDPAARASAFKSCRHCESAVLHQGNS